MLIAKKFYMNYQWRKKLNFYAFIANLLGEGDIYPPTEFAKPISVSRVVSAWKETAELIRNSKAPKQLGIFIFVPFCKTKCFFCPFFSFPLSSKSQLDIFTESLVKEMEFFKGVFTGLEFNTLWFGGGTPSILDEEHLRKIFNALYKLFSFTKDVQITFECSCSSTDYKKLKFLHSLGVNRVTLGIQSLNDRVLKENNRLFQNKKTSLKLIKDAKRAGIGLVNVDLMCGLPGDNIESFKKGLKEVIALKPELIHINPFFPSSETNFFKKRKKYFQEDILRRTKEAEIGSRFLLEAGYNKAEGAFLGFCKFPGAANQQEIDRIIHSSSFISFGPSAESHAFARLDYTNAYFKNQWDKITLPKYVGIRFNTKEEMRKHVITNLRHTIIRETFRKLFGRDIVQSFPKELNELKKNNLVHIDSEKIFFKIKTRQEQLILAKHFFNHEYLNNIQKKFGVCFKKEKNYFKEISKLIDITV